MKKNYYNLNMPYLYPIHVFMNLNWLFSLVTVLLISSTLNAQIALRGTALTNTSTNTNLTLNKPVGVVAGDFQQYQEVFLILFALQKPSNQVDDVDFLKANL